MLVNIKLYQHHTGSSKNGSSVIPNSTLVPVPHDTRHENPPWYQLGNPHNNHLHKCMYRRIHNKFIMHKSTHTNPPQASTPTPSQARNPLNSHPAKSHLPQPKHLFP